MHLCAYYNFHVLIILFYMINYKNQIVLYNLLQCLLVYFIISLFHIKLSYVPYVSQSLSNLIQVSVMKGQSAIVIC